MQNALRVRRMETGEKLQSKVDGGCGVERPAIANTIAEGATLHEFHDDHWNTADLVGAEDVDAVRMIYCSSKLAFAEEAGSLAPVG